MDKPYVVEVLEVEARPLAAIPAQFNFREVPTRLLGVLTEVWSFIRANKLTPTGHNVVIYDELGMTAAGVEVGADIPHDHRVMAIPTPAGRVAMTVHWGEYSDLGAAHEAISTWCAANGHAVTRSHWEVYGDWAEHAADRRTDVFYLLA